MANIPRTTVASAGCVGVSDKTGQGRGGMILKSGGEWVEMKHLRKTYRLSVTDSGSRTTCQESRCQENQKVISNCAAVLEGFLCCARGTTDTIISGKEILTGLSLLVMFDLPRDLKVQFGFG